MKHVWKRAEWNDNETIDTFALSEGYHNGPECINCGFSFCMHCVSNANEIMNEHECYGGTQDAVYDMLYVNGKPTINAPVIHLEDNVYMAKFGDEMYICYRDANDNLQTLACIDSQYITRFLEN